MKRNTLLLLLLVFICPLAFGEQDYHDSLNLETTNQLNNINLKINKLITENDSLKNVVNSIKTEDYKSLEVITKVQGFYESAWTKLIWFVSITGGVFAIILPYYLNSQQKKEFEINKEKFNDYVDKEIQKSGISIKESNKNEIGKSLIDFEKEMNKLFTNIKTEQTKDISKLYGMTYFLQATRFFNDEKYLFALKSYLSSLKYQMAGKDNKQISKTLNRITKNIDLIKTSNTIIPSEINNRINIIIEFITNNYENEYDQEIENINSVMNKP
jgi:hypothetical protein